MQISVNTNEDYESCNDCIHSDDSVEICKLRECVHAVEVKECYEPSGDLISRQAVLDLIEHYNSDGLGSVFYGYEEGVKFANAVNKLPSVNPQKPKTDVLDKIRAEIKRPLEIERYADTDSAKAQAIALNLCIEIIDKHTKGESE